MKSSGEEYGFSLQQKGIYFVLLWQQKASSHLYLCVSWVTDTRPLLGIKERGRCEKASGGDTRSGWCARLECKELRSLSRKRKVCVQGGGRGALWGLAKFHRTEGLSSCQHCPGNQSVTSVTSVQTWQPHFHQQTGNQFHVLALPESACSLSVQPISYTSVLKRGFRSKADKTTSSADHLPAWKTTKCSLNQLVSHSSKAPTLGQWFSSSLCKN